MMTIVSNAVGGLTASPSTVMPPDSAISVGLHSRDNTVEGTPSLRPGPHYPQTFVRPREADGEGTIVDDLRAIQLFGRGRARRFRDPCSHRMSRPRETHRCRVGRRTLLVMGTWSATSRRPARARQNRR